MKMKKKSSLLKMKYYEEEVVTNAWSSELHSDIIGLISEKLRSLSLCQYVRFGSVCFCWRSFCIDHYQHLKLPSKLPVLLIPISSPLTTTHNPSSSLATTDEEDDEDEEVDGEDDDKEDEEVDGQDEEEKEVDGQGDDKEEEKEVDGQGDDKEEVEIEVEVEDDEDEDEDEEKEVDGQGDDKEEVEIEVEVEDNEDEDEVEDDEEIEYLILNEEDEKMKTMYYYDPRDIWEGQDYKQRFKNIRNFYSLSEKRVYQDFPLHVPYYKNIRGSSHGWLVTVEECCRDDGVDYYPVRLLNPFRTDNNEIQLPPLSAPFKFSTPNDSYYLRKACLSANPSSLADLKELVVLGVSWHNQVSFCKPGDKDWSHLKDVYEHIRDIFCYQSQFYAILSSGFVFAFVFDAAQRRPKHTYTLGILPPKVDDNYPRNDSRIVRYLVVSNGELFQIRRHITLILNSYHTSQFLVFKQDPMDRSEWVETKTLNDHMLFLGAGCTSMSLSALDFPGCKPNSIYYTDDFEMYYHSNPKLGPRDIGVFNVEDGSFEPHYSSKVIMPSPIWIQPML